MSVPPPGADAGGGALALDHLVVAAATLAAGVRWCEDTLGVTPAPGGAHALMGTHNRLLAVATPALPRAYLEIIAIDPAAPGPRDGRQRWFGLDSPALQARLSAQGPQLVGWVARSSALAAHRWGLIGLGLQPGEPVAASRPTPEGLLQWQIVLRHDGRLLHGGAVPTLIQWQGPHPAAALPASPVALQTLQLGAALSPGLRALLQMPGVQARPARAGASGPALSAVLATPRGPVTLCSAAAAAP